MPQIVSGIWGKVRTDDIIDRAVTRAKLEYPTEDVSFAYLAAINKVQILDYAPDSYINSVLLTSDNFTDKAVKAILATNRGAIYSRFQDGSNYYYLSQDNGLSTADFKIRKCSGGSYSDLATEAIDLPDYSSYVCILSVSGSTLKAYRSDLSSAKITATDSEFSSGCFGIIRGLGNHDRSVCEDAFLLAPTSPAPKALSIIEVDKLKQNLVAISQLNNIPNFMKIEVKKYKTLKSRGFTDEEIKLLLGNIRTQIDLASVTYGVFEYKPEHDTFLITITSGNPYTGKKAILEQIEYAKSKNFIVLKPPKDYKEAVEQYKQLKQHFTGWVAGKDNYAYQTLGSEDIECCAVADFYHGNLIQEQRIKGVPEWELRRTLLRWKDRLEKARINAELKEKHMKKLEECLKR